MSSREIQLKSLEIMKDIHEFCVANNIKYSLEGGSLIGAVRHKGFIPWDDDIDIVMPRPEYDRFIKLFNGYKGYALKARDAGDPSVDILFARVCDTKETLVTSHIPFCDETTGLWVDIFPLDAAEDDKELFAKRVKLMQKKWEISFYQRALKKPIGEVRGLVAKFKYIGKIPFLLYGDIIGKLNKECKRLSWGATKHYALISFLQYGIKEYHRVEVFDDYVLLPFEDAHFFAMKGYHEVLTDKWGDYMKLPPKDQQVPKHGFEFFFWKNDK